MRSGGLIARGGDPRETSSGGTATLTSAGFAPGTAEGGSAAIWGAAISPPAFGAGRTLALWSCVQCAGESGGVSAGADAVS